MNLKSILNKPYKYGLFFKNIKYFKILNIFINFLKNNKLNYLFKINKIKLKNIFIKSNNLYKSFILFKYLNNRLDIFLLKIGICKTIYQSRYIIRYGKILKNNIVIYDPNDRIIKGDFIKIISFKYGKLLKNNINILKIYLINTKFLINYTKYSGIINMNTYKVYCIQ